MVQSYNPELIEMGARIRKRREQISMSATDLAIQADLSTTALSHIETGQTAARADTLMRIASCLHVSLQELQCKELDQYSSIPSSLQPIIQKLSHKGASEQDKLIRMFSALVEIM